MRTLLIIISISITVISIVGGSLTYIYSHQAISTREWPHYSSYMMTEYFAENKSGFDSIQVGYYRYMDPVNATISIMANGPHKFNDCSIIYQSKRSNKMLWHDENITNRGEGFYDDPTRVLNSTNRLIFECDNPPYSLSWPYLTMNGATSPENTISLSGNFEPESNITLSIYSCKVTACDDENRDVIVGKNILANQEGNFTYSFMIPQTSDDLLYADVKVDKKEYILGTAILA